jgi:hypothetical protein
MFKDGQKNVHYEERSVRPSVVSEGLIRSVHKKICGRRSFTISQLSCEFPQILRTLLYEIITVRLGYRHKFCAIWFRKCSLVRTKRTKWLRL